MKTTLLVPVLNEIEGMKKIMPLVKREWVDQVIILDGNSTDGTIEYARSQGYTVVIQKKPGLRKGYEEAWKHITGDIVITFSPDGNSIPELIPPLIEKMKEGYDMVIVSRYAKGAKSYDDDIITGFGNWMFTSLINLVFAAHYTDAMVIYRAYKKDLMARLELDKDSSFDFEEKLFRTKISWEPLLSMRAAKRRLKIGEIPGDEPARLGGQRKLKIFQWGAAFLTEVIKERFTP
ncbi:MAG: glycosyltransferase family 2 protein [Candidatus Omnitrophica bacterium]|nr:glycosyltransferase family 2 protein [Candidatus Omnitrophota bacterium]